MMAKRPILPDMTRLLLAMMFLSLAVKMAAAQDCPKNPDIEPRLDELINAIRQAPSEMAAQPISNQMWELWLEAPDARAQNLLDQGIARLRVSDHDGAEATFTQLVEYCPDYAEGYNQRAFSKFLRGEYGGALDDLERAIERSPKHVGALSGRALTLIGMGRTKAAQSALRAALDINPWLSERALLVEPDGEEL